MLIVPAQDGAGGRGGTSSMRAPGGAESKQQPGRGCLRAILKAKRKQLCPLWSGVSAELLPAVPGGAAAISGVLVACRAGCWAVPTLPAVPRGMVKAEQWLPGSGGKKKKKRNQEKALHGQLDTGEHPEASEISAPPKAATARALPMPSFTLCMSPLFSLCPRLCLCAGMWSNKTSSKADGKFQFGSLLWKKKRSSSRKKKIIIIKKTRLEAMYHHSQTVERV